MKLSARNVLGGKITEVVMGQTTARVKIQVGAGAVITARSRPRPPPIST